MIETMEALGALDSILAVSGIDGVFVGPADLSIALSRGEICNPMHPGVHEAIEHALERSHAMGKKAAIYAHTPERAAKLVSSGFDFVAMSSDINMLRAGAKTMRTLTIHG